MRLSIDSPADLPSLLASKIRIAAEDALNAHGVTLAVCGRALLRGGRQPVVIRRAIDAACSDARALLDGAGEPWRSLPLVLVIHASAAHGQAAG